MVDALRERAKDALLNLELAREERLEGREPASDLLNMEGMDRALAFKMAEIDIRTMEDLAEQAVDELMAIEGMDEERAAALIMKARSPGSQSKEKRTLVDTTVAQLAELVGTPAEKLLNNDRCRFAKKAASDSVTDLEKALCWPT